MRKKELRFRAAAAAVCAALLLGGLAALGPLLTPKWRGDELWEPATDVMTGFYAEPEGSIDVLFLGSSHIFCGVDPLAIYDETGIRSYDLSSGLQRLWVSYYYLLEALKTQTPSLVVLDTWQLFVDTPNAETRNRMALDYMRPSAEKWAAVRASMQPEETFLSYVFPAIRFHERIFDLGEQDVRWLLERDRHNYLHGYRMEYMDKITPVTLDPYDKSSGDTGGLWPEGSKSLYYLDRIAETCAERGIPLLIATVPVASGWDAGKRDLIRAYAAEKGVDFHDFIPDIEAMGLSPETDFYDRGHLNIYGADKFSRYLGRYLRDGYLGETAADPALSAVWDADYALFRERTGL